MLTREDDIDVHALRRQGWTITAQPTGPLVRAHLETVACMLEPQFHAAATMLRDTTE